MKQQGFTLIELMIVIAILGILAAIAIPTYQDYMIRAKVSEGVNVMSAAKASVADYYESHNAFPTNNTAAGVTSVVTSYVNSLTVGTGGAIDASIATFTGIGSSATLHIVLTPTTTSGAIMWKCTNTGSTGTSKYVPSTCR